MTKGITEKRKYLLSSLQETKTHNHKNKISKSVERGMMQVKQIEKGKLKSIPLKKLLDAIQ